MKNYILYKLFLFGLVISLTSCILTEKFSNRIHSENVYIYQNFNPPAEKTKHCVFHKGKQVIKDRISLGNFDKINQLRIPNTSDKWTKEDFVITLKHSVVLESENRELEKSISVDPYRFNFFIQELRLIENKYTIDFRYIPLSFSYPTPDKVYKFGPVSCVANHKYNFNGQTNYKIVINKTGKYVWRRFWVEDENTGKIEWEFVELDPGSPSKPNENKF